MSGLSPESASGKAVHLEKGQKASASELLGGWWESMGSLASPACFTQKGHISVGTFFFFFFFFFFSPFFLGFPG